MQKRLILSILIEIPELNNSQQEENQKYTKELTDIGGASQSSNGRPGMRTRLSYSAGSRDVRIRQKFRRDYPGRTGWRNYREDLGGFHLLRSNTEDSRCSVTASHP